MPAAGARRDAGCYARRASRMICFMAILLISGQTYYHRAPGIIVLSKRPAFSIRNVEKKNFVGLFHLPDPAVQREAEAPNGRGVTAGLLFGKNLRAKLPTTLRVKHAGTCTGHEYFFCFCFLSFQEMISQGSCRSRVYRNTQRPAAYQTMQ